MDGLTTGNLTNTQRDQLMQNLKQQIAVVNAQELLTKITEKCFKKCIAKPGTSLDSSEQDMKDKILRKKDKFQVCFQKDKLNDTECLKCIAMCMDRYMDSFNVVSRAYSERIQKERNRL